MHRLNRYGDIAPSARSRAARRLAFFSLLPLTLASALGCSREFNSSLRDGRQHLRTGSGRDTVVLTQRELDACLARPSCKAKLRNVSVQIVE